MTSSTVVVVSLTPVAVSAAPVAIWVVVASISLAEVPSIPIPSFSSCVIRRKPEIISANALPSTSRLEIGLTWTVKSPAAILWAASAIPPRNWVISMNVADSRPISSLRFRNFRLT